MKKDAAIRRDRYEAKLKLATDTVNLTKQEIERLETEAEFARAQRRPSPSGAASSRSRPTAPSGGSSGRSPVSRRPKGIATS
ncbi:MAG: hypothetical protein IPM79_14835 [Polyangiaceae bacterium]|nr:hypothetical protein [Polyangiaceae bacterium]